MVTQIRYTLIYFTQGYMKISWSYPNECRLRVTHLDNTLNGISSS